MITINQIPDELTPAYNPMRYHVTSNNTVQDNFKFICDIYIDGTYVRREKRSKHPDFNACVFDVHRIVESFVTHTLPMDLTFVDTPLLRNNDWCTVVCKFGEEYGLSSSGVTVYPDLSVSSGVYAFNGSINEDEFIDWDANDYILDSSGSMFCMTLPQQMTPLVNSTFRGNALHRNQNYFAQWYYNVANKVDVVVIITYDINGNFIEEYQIDNQFDSGSGQERFNIFPIGYNANDLDAGGFITGTPPIYTDSVYYAKIYTTDSGLVQTSEAIYFNLVERCSRFDNYEVHWLDRLGCMNTFIFTEGNTQQVKIDRKEYKQQTGTMGSTSFTVAKSDRGTQNYFTSSNKEITLRSGWITENEYNWLMYLLESPQVFLYINNEYISMNVTSSSYEIKQVANGNLINLEVTLKYSVTNQRQRY